jgi:hypothetical protein
MPLTSKNRFLKIDQNGFTLIELLVSSVVSIVLLGLIAGVFQSQTGIFTRELDVGVMEANGRSVVDFISRGVQNAGYKVNRGTRFLAASDHYISLAFDDDDDEVIQHDEIFTYAVSHPTEALNTKFTIKPFFDFDGDKRVDQNESRLYEIELSLQKNPPFNLYVFTPNKNDNIIKRYIAARNIDNLILRYYDKNNDPLPVGVATEFDEDGNEIPIPPYILQKEELNEVRKVEVVVMVRSKKEDSNENYINKGDYIEGSVAVNGFTGSYSDRYRRKTLKAVSSPRNLSTAGFGKISLSANPNPINCPNTLTNVTADVVDNKGESIESIDGGVSVKFNSSHGVINPKIAFVNGGEVGVALNYDWSSASITSTVSASAEVDFKGKKISILNAIPVTFDGSFFDDFELGPRSSWSDEKSINEPLWLAEKEKYRLKSSGSSQINLNGCTLLKNYQLKVAVQKTDNHNTKDFFSLIVRSQPSDRPEETFGYYSAEVECVDCEGIDPTSHKYRFSIVKRNAQNVEVKVFGRDDLDPEEFIDTNEDYSLMLRVSDNTLLAKFWKSSEPEPTDDSTGPVEGLGGKINGRTIRTAPLTELEFTQGNFGLSTNTNNNNFDDVVLSNAPKGKT